MALRRFGARGTVRRVLFWLLAAAPFSTASLQASIVGSKHDFSSNGWSGGQICLPCHTPHNANATVAGAPLWNHQVTAAVFGLYSSPTFSGVAEQPRPVSKLCLSCHDGTLAVDSFGGRAGGMFITGRAQLGFDLSNDHPLSFKWQHQDLGGGGGNKCGNCHNLHSSPSMISVLPFFSGYVECATCHDVHGGTSYPKLLRKALAGSEICLHCHAK
jgi:predicted CXXCH cytochrome family protein